MSSRRNESVDAPFAGPGEVRALCRAIDWSDGLGPAEGWSQNLKSTVRLCLDSAAPMAVLVGPDLRMLYNEAYLSVVGSAAHPWALGRPAREVWPEFWEQLGPELERVTERGEAILFGEGPLSSEVSRGERPVFAYTHAPIREQDGRIAGALVFIRPSKTTPSAVLGEEVLFSTLRLAGIGAWELDLVDLTIRRSLHHDEIFGYQQLLPRWTYERFLAHVVAEDRGEVERSYRRALETREDSTVECRILRSDGETRWVWLIGRHVRAAGARHPRFAGIIQDITQRKQAEEAVQRSKEMFSKAFHGNISAMAIARLRDGNLIEVNDSFLELMRLPREAVIGKTTLQVQIWKDAEQRAGYMRQVEQQGLVRNVELRLTRPTGEPWFGLFSSALTELEGEPATITSIVDITEQKLAELALERANAKLLDADRRKDAFMAVLSHELRNPLAPIKSALYILDHAAPGGDQARRAKEVIDRQVAQLTRLVDDLLDITRIASGAIQLQRQRLELNQLAQRALEDHRALFEKRAVRVELQTAPMDVFIRADRNRIAQVIGNLLQNAVKFTPAGGRVSLSVSSDPGAMQATVQVSDTGIGLSPDTLVHIFEPFRQVDPSLDRSKGGLGLGLSLVKSLVQQHGGSVEATSAGVGKGAEFSVRLPLELGAEAAREPARAAAAKVHRRVLVIDDNVDAAETLREALELDGHHVAVAHDGPQGLAKAHEFHPDFVLCDIGLPGMDGYAVARAFRADEALRKAHLIALSGYAQPVDMERSASAGFEQHLAKPPSFERLESVLSGAPGQPAPPCLALSCLLCGR